MTFDPSTLTVTGQELYDDLAPLMVDRAPGLNDSDHGYAGAVLCGAVATMVDPVAMLARDQADGTPGWAILFQPYNELFTSGALSADHLTWMAQFVGDSVAVAAATTIAEKQYLATHPQNLKRGRPAAIAQAVQATLTGTQTVNLVPNPFGTQGPFSLGVVTFTTETPSLAATQAAAIAAAPAWVTISFSTIASWSIGALETAHTTITAIEATYPTIAAIEGNLP